MPIVKIDGLSMARQFILCHIDHVLWQRTWPCLLGCSVFMFQCFYGSLRTGSCFDSKYSPTSLSNPMPQWLMNPMNTLAPCRIHLPPPSGVSLWHCVMSTVSWLWPAPWGDIENGGFNPLKQSMLVPHGNIGWWKVNVLPTVSLFSIAVVLPSHTKRFKLVCCMRLISSFIPLFLIFCCCHNRNNQVLFSHHKPSHHTLCTACFCKPDCSMHACSERVDTGLSLLCFYFCFLYLLST